MGKMFQNLKSDNLAKAEDRLGGGFEAKPSGSYEAVLKMVYAGQSSGGAQSITIIADLGGSELRETVYITNKSGENFYSDKNDPKKKLPLPGFTLVNDICLLVTGSPLEDQETAEKKVKVYDPSERKEVPTDVPVLTDLLGQKIRLGILREISDQEKKDDSGNYVKQYDDSGKIKTRTQNTIDKAFHPETFKTVNEYLLEVETPEFHEAWVQRNTGKDRNRATRDSGGNNAGSTGAGRPGGASSSNGGETRKKLFGK